MRIHPYTIYLNEQSNHFKRGKIRHSEWRRWCEHCEGLHGEAWWPTRKGGGQVQMFYRILLAYNEYFPLCEPKVNHQAANYKLKSWILGVSPEAISSSGSLEALP